MRTLLLILLLTMLPVVGGLAAETDIYTGEAIVADKGKPERARALPLALGNALQKASGLRSFDDYPPVSTALRNAPDILIAAGYRNVEVTLPDGSVRDELRLVARFSSEKVDELIRNLQLPLWPEERKETDIWIVVDNGLDRQVMPVEFAYAWQAMADAAAWRGLPLKWPVEDENGQYAVDAQLLWGGYTEDLGIGPGSAAMISAARREGTDWNVRSNLTYNNQSWSWKVRDLDLQAALTESMHQAVDLVSAAHSISPSDLGKRTHRITVSGMYNSSDYIRCLNYLQGLDIVSGVSVISAQAGNVFFSLELEALPRYLEETILDGQFLGFDETQNTYYLLQ